MKKISKKIFVFGSLTFFSLSFLSFKYNDYILNPNNEFQSINFSTLKTLKSTNNNQFSIKNYFQNLNKFSPYNKDGSCGYVSFIQYLSYFDTFYNDNIINDKFDKNDGNKSSITEANKNSPGVEKFNSYSGTLYNYANNNKNIDYQAYLMTINNNYQNTNNSEKFNPSISMANYQNLLNNINNLNLKFTYENSIKKFGKGNHKTDTSIKFFDNYVKNKLDEGYPVILHIGGDIIDTKDEIGWTFKGYHSVVAYYYDEEGIHCNFGWGSQYTDTVFNAPDYYIICAGYIDDTSLSHYHSNNYIINNNYFCGCHKHNYNLNYEWKSYTKHVAYCLCNNSVEIGHVVKSSSSSSQYMKCILCGGDAEIGFTYNDIRSNDVTYLENGNIIISNYLYNKYINGTFNLGTLYENK